ncbi:unnamed protein product [Phytophthora fragariaefolia]|uniref:Unnamed protein product n=1 Tax=Phytophthora fragariaefolia TaxID=1490495 RepID=A0A9W6U7M7_9STRA|nr:unnamed protein product [Phytophthora fragariaefolia]
MASLKMDSKTASRNRFHRLLNFVRPNMPRSRHVQRVKVIPYNPPRDQRVGTPGHGRRGPAGDEHPARQRRQVAQQLPGRHPAHGAGGSRRAVGAAAAQEPPVPTPPAPPLAPDAATRVAVEAHGAQLGLARAQGDALPGGLERARGGACCSAAVPCCAGFGAFGCAMCGAGKHGKLLRVDGVHRCRFDPGDEQLRVLGRFVRARHALQPESKTRSAQRTLQHQLQPEYGQVVFLQVVNWWLTLFLWICNICETESAFMLPCYEAIWYTIAALSAVGLALYFASFQAYKSDGDTIYKSLTLQDEPKYPCSIVTMPSVWVLQLLPMLMIQRSVSQEAVRRAIMYSGGVCVIFVICNMTLYKVGNDIADGITMMIYILLLVFYCWAKFAFHARATFDFFFVAAVITSIMNIISSIMGLAHVDPGSTLPIVHCIVFGFDSLIVVAVLLSLRADTRYWLAIDDNGSGTTASSSAMRRYVNLLSERGMITNFSTRTSVYDVHHMIEEHRHNVVDFSALALDCIIAQGATSIVMRGTLRRSTPVPIALKIYTDVQVTNEEVQRFSRETALNVQLSHPNVVRFYGLCVVPPSISLIFEFCEYGALDLTLRENPEIWTLAAKLKAWLDACRAVAYLHSFSPPLLHRDIKTDNFLVGQDFLIKLADFGEANLLRPRTDGTMTIAGTVDYMAPEMIKGGKTARYGTAVDVYSLMITLWQIMVPSRSPWEDKSHLEVYRSVANGERPPLLPCIPKACAEILEAGWAANPGDRVAVEDIIPCVHRLWLLAMHQKPLKRTKH